MLKGADMKKQTRRQFGTGFTLVELLVVIAIIALLLAILMPALNKVRMQGQCVVCKTRMKDIGNMCTVYMQDNANKLPPSWASQAELAAGMSDPGKRWYQRLAPYYKLKQSGDNSVYDYKLFRCPTQEKYNKVGFSPGDDGAKGILGFNIWFMGAQNTPTSTNTNTTCDWWRSPNAIKQPSELPLIGDYSADPYRGIPGSGGMKMVYTYPNQLAIKYGWAAGKPIQMAITMVNSYGPSPNHGTPNCNFLFTDLHVDARNICKAGKWPWIGANAAEQAKGTYFHPTRNPGTCP